MPVIRVMLFLVVAFVDVAGGVSVPICAALADACVVGLGVTTGGFDVPALGPVSAALAAAALLEALA